MARGTVLVADDDPLTGMVLSAVLGEHGFDVVVAASHDEAVGRLREDVPDVAVVTEGLSGTAGQDAPTTVQSASVAADVPTVLLTADAADGDRSDPVAAGAWAHLRTPCSPVHLLELVESLIDDLAGETSVTAS